MAFHDDGDDNASSHCRIWDNFDEDVRSRSPLPPGSWDTFYRSMERAKEERTRKRTERALNAGFQTWEELNQHEMDEWAKHDAIRRQALEERCALMGKTVQQYWQEQEVDRNMLPLPDLPQSDCDGKSI